ncbi:MAG: GGDEF domain-containing protein, partial [Eubacteriales bacterium]|nr:GGDEF domain-containing protein [Eubacteriales bacterium]
ILQDDTVFVLSSAGIYAVLREELLKNAEDMNYIYLDSRAGLHENLVANAWILHEPEKGKAYLATSFGTTVFDLQEYDERPVNFKVRVASITVDGVESAMDNDEHFSFSKKVNRLEIRPEIINYSTVDPIISCYLEGFDKHPIVMPQSELSTIVYTNLPAGKYSFHITLLDSESGVSISEKVYSLEKETEFTDTIWFYILIVGGVVLIATWIAMLTARRLYIRKMREKEAELEKSRLISATDELTGLKNRFAMREEFPNYVGKQLIVTMMDIDHFKQFNDTYGHDMGDMILKRVSEIILEFYAENGVAFRFGGDEFLFLDMNASSTVVKNKLEALAEKVRHIQIDGCESTITVSYGSVNGFASTKDELRSIWKQADKSLYEIKKKRSS